MKPGAFTLIITPFKDDFSLDEAALANLVERQVASGIHGIAPLGVTGESTLLTKEEEKKVIQIIVKHAKGKALICPDTCTSSLWEAKEKVKMFADIGADYISVFSPFFVLPKPDGIIKFYEEIANVSPVPILLHNAKDRTGVELTPEISGELAKHSNIVGIKDGNKGIDHLAKVLYLTKDQDFKVFTGKDTTAFPMIAFGGAGSFTVSGNIIPGVMKNLVDLAIAGKLEEAKKIHHDYYLLFEAIRFETNPMAAKMALQLMGLINGNLRLPLTSLSEAKTKVLKQLLEERNLI
jgi:4-hydroxy-tetrahydrodipicolinate synthase